MSSTSLPTKKFVDKLSRQIQIKSLTAGDQIFISITPKIENFLKMNSLFYEPVYLFFSYFSLLIFAVFASSTNGLVEYDPLFPLPNIAPRNPTVRDHPKTHSKS